jgi:hypothetical protein
MPHQVGILRDDFESNTANTHVFESQIPNNEGYCIFWVDGAWSSWKATEFNRTDSKILAELYSHVDIAHTYNPDVISLDNKIYYIGSEGTRHDALNIYLVTKERGANAALHLSIASYRQASISSSSSDSGNVARNMALLGRSLREYEEAIGDGNAKHSLSSFYLELYEQGQWMSQQTGSGFRENNWQVGDTAFDHEHFTMNPDGHFIAASGGRINIPGSRRISGRSENYLALAYLHATRTFKDTISSHPERRVYNWTAWHVAAENWTRFNQEWRMDADEQRPDFPVNPIAILAHEYAHEFRLDSSVNPIIVAQVKDGGKEFTKTIEAAFFLNQDNSSPARRFVQNPPVAAGQTSQPERTDDKKEFLFWVSLFGMIASPITSIATLVFTWISLHRKRSEEILMRLELQKRQLEIEQLRLEIERARLEADKQKPNLVIVSG